MAQALTVDSVAVSLVADPAGIFRGIEAGQAAIDKFRQEANAQPITLSLSPTVNLTEAEAALTTLAERIASVGGITIPVRLTTAGVEASLGAVRSQLTQLGGITVPITVEAAQAQEALATLRGAVTIPVTLDTAALSSQVAEARAALTALREQLVFTPVPVRLDLASAEVALTSLERQLASLPAVTVPVRLNALSAGGAIESLRAQLASVGGVTVPVALDLSKAEASLAALKASLQGIGAGGVALPGFEAFSEASIASFGRMEAALTELTTSLQPVAAGFNRFFLGVIQGAAQQTAAIEQNAARQRVAFGSVASGSPFGAIAADLSEVRLALAQGTANAENYAAAIANAKNQLAFLASQGVRPTTSEMRTLNQLMGTQQLFAQNAARADLTLRSSLTVLASQAVGTSSTLGRLAEAFLLFGGGTGLVVGVAASVLVLAKAFELVTASSREANDRVNQTIQGLQQTRLLGGSDVEQATRKLGDVETRLAAIRDLVQQLQDQKLFNENSFDLQSIGLTIGSILGLDSATKKLAATELLETDAKRAQTEAIKEQIKEITKAQQAARDALIGAISQAPSLGLDNTGAQAERLAFIRESERLIRSGNLGITDQVALQQKVNTAIEGQQAPLLRNLTLQQRSIQESLAAAGAAGTLANATAQVAAGEGFGALIEKYRALEAAAGSDVEQVQKLADKRHEIEKLRQSTEDTVKSFLNIGGAARAVPTLKFQTKFDFTDPTKALEQLLLELQQRVKPKIVIDLAPLAQVGGSDGSLVPRLDKAVQQSFDAATGTVNDLNDEIDRAFIASGRFGFEAVASAHDARQAWQKLNDEIHDTTRGLDAIVRAAHNIGLIGDAAANAIGSVEDLADSIGNVVEKASTGNILGLIGSGINAIGAIGNALGFGKSEDQKAAEAALHENTAAIRANTVLRSQGLTGIGGSASAADIIRQALSSSAGSLNASNTQEGGDTGRSARNELVSQLAGLGLNFTDLQRIAKEFGITILEHGKLVGEALGQLATEIDAANAAASHFSQSFADQLDFADIKAKINGTFGDAGAQFQRDLAAAGQSGSSFVADFFKGIDPTTEKAAFQKRLNEFADLFGPNSSFFNDPANQKLLAGLSPEDWKKILVDGASAMQDLNDKTKQLADQFGSFNLPTGFRSEALAFQSADPVSLAQAIPGGPRLQNIGSDGAALPVGQASTVNLTINVTQSPGESGTEFTDRVVEVLRRKVFVQGGDTLDFSRIN